MSFVTDLEQVVEEVSDWAVNTVLDVTNALMPDGKPFDYELQSMDEQLRDYYTVRGQPQMWAAWIGDRASEIIQKLTDAGVPQDEIYSVHPWDIAQRYAVSYSASMEAELRKRSAHLP